MPIGWIVAALVSGSPLAMAELSPERPKALLPGEAGAWISAADYPPAALRAGAEGVAEARMDIGPSGRLTGCTITRSSGNADLDVATCRALFLRARFEAGRAGTSVTRRVNWKLPVPAPGTSGAAGPIDVAVAPPKDVAFGIEMLIGPDGVVRSCRVLKAVPAPLPAPCVVGARIGPGFVRDGKPISALVQTTMSVTTTFP